jgi:type IV fimbrial biogenesis protein FimT
MIDMIRRNLNIRSGCSSHGHTPHIFRRHRGFTIVEILITVALVAISAALAVPSYRTMVEKRQLTNGAEQLAAFVNTVQGISLRTNRVVTVSYTRHDHETWCIGAVLGETPCIAPGQSCTETNACTIDGQKFVLDNSNTDNREFLHEISSGDGAYSFDPIRGLFQDPADALTMELHTDSRDYKLNLVVNNTGRVMLCSKDDSHDVPGYDICP